MSSRPRTKLRDGSRPATTVGYGPRFPHSTGQLHRADRGSGLFVQLITGELRDAPIPNVPGMPESTISFGVLKAAQDPGDRKALPDIGRRVIRSDLSADVRGGLDKLPEALG